jgi:hypothetical protein
MELVFDESRVVKLRASFALEKNTQLLVYQWFKSLCFSSGYASTYQGWLIWRNADCME